MRRDEWLGVSSQAHSTDRAVRNVARQRLNTAAVRRWVVLFGVLIVGLVVIVAVRG